MNRNLPALIGILAMPFAASALAQNAVTAIKSTEVAPGVHVLEGADGFAGGNMTLLTGDEQIVLIDDGLGSVAELLIDKTQELAGRGVDFIINTHVHGDHTGSNADFADSGAIVVTHDNIRRRLVEDSTPAGGDAGIPVLTFNDAVTFHVNGNEAYVFHIPAAHTDGDAAIYIKNLNVLVAGDVHFHSMFPFIDLDTGGNVDGFIAGMQKLIAMIDDETTVIPGHGTVTDKAGLEADLAMLIDARDSVRALVDEGKSGAEILVANPLEPHAEQYNWRFITTERMTETLVRYLTRK